MTAEHPAATDRPLDHHRLAAARLHAATRFPYLAAVLFASPVVAAPGQGRLTVDTAWRLHADPTVVEATPVGISPA